MKQISLRISSCLSLAISLSGCLYGQCMNGACAVERDAYLKSIKAYGEHWVKEGSSIEQWRRDWTGCGGDSRGSYSTEVPNGSSTEAIITASREMRKGLGGCMQNLGYKFHPGEVFREP